MFSTQFLPRITTTSSFHAWISEWRRAQSAEAISSVLMRRGVPREEVSSAVFRRIYGDPTPPVEQNSGECARGAAVVLHQGLPLTRQ